MASYCFAIILCLIPLSAGGNSEVVGGKITKPHTRKYMASLQFYGHHICGGFLIQEDFVLTAAHCTSVTPMTVVLGAHNITNKKERSQQSIQVDEYIQHPHYSGGFEFDIMLLKLKKKAKLNEFVQTIALPKKDKITTALKECSVPGWGKMHPSEGSPASGVLREAEETIQFNFECKNIWQQFFNSQHMICTKFNETGGSLCNGDSGGPLICKNKPLGITAFTKLGNCNDQKYPHVFTKISSFLPWIKKVTGGRSEESKTMPR
ncbi:unnamed protein product [Knipowitschia caucasica]